MTHQRDFKAHERELSVAKLLADKGLDADTRAYFKAFFDRSVPVYQMDDVAYVWAKDRDDDVDDAFTDDDVVSVANDLAESGDNAGARRPLRCTRTTVQASSRMTR